MSTKEKTGKEKHTLRKTAFENRRKAAIQGNTSFCQNVCKLFLENIKLENKKSIIGGYWPVRWEMNILPLMENLYAQGYACGLPVIAGSSMPLVFRSWHPGEGLAPGKFGIPTPVAFKKNLIPNVLLVPMLAFNKKGYRLGYGGGYYDHTLAKLRDNNKDTLAIGIAYSAQLNEQFYHDENDQKLDCLINEVEIIKFTDKI